MYCIVLKKNKKSSDRTKHMSAVVKIKKNHTESYLNNKYFMNCSCTFSSGVYMPVFGALGSIFRPTYRRYDGTITFI